MNFVDLSVIIPTYNRAGKVVECLQEYNSILRRSTKPVGISFEFIVVDDNSNDNTFEKIHEFSMLLNNVKVLRNNKNLGPGPARNQGLKHANGVWVWFLDDDDTLNLESLEFVFDKLNTEIDIFAHSLSNTYSEKSKYPVLRNICKFHERQEAFNYIFNKDFLLRNEILFETGLHEDIGFIAECLIAANKIQILNEQVVLKGTSVDAITSEMTPERIDGYTKAFDRIARLSSHDNFKVLKTELAEIHTQFLGVILYLSSKEPEPSAWELLAYLKNSKLLQHQLVKQEKLGEQSTNFELAAEAFSRLSVEHVGLIYKQLKEVFSSYLSCKDLESSLFLAPNEIRACCKRFFVNGQQKGDVVLLPASEGITLDDINEAKRDLVNRINTGSAPECAGCPYISRFSPSADAKKVEYISYENFSYCNMRCTYCSPKYYGGAEALYDAADITINLFSEMENVSSDVHVVFGGGEPTLSPNFLKINKVLKDAENVRKIRILSNSLRHSNDTKTFLKDAKYQLVTSIDAGTDETFLNIRKRGELHAVLSNLREYCGVVDDKRRITIKYILTSENYCSPELESFVSAINSHGLSDCLFQISCDFRIETAPLDITQAIYELSVRLLTHGVKFIFLDDLIRDRVKIGEEQNIKIRQYLSDLSLDPEFLAGLDLYGRVVMWGNGLQAQWYKKNTHFGQSNGFLDVVENAEQLREIIRTNKIKCSELFILPCGVQSTYEIIKEIEASVPDIQILDKIIL